MVLQWSDDAETWFPSGERPMLTKKLSRHGNSLALVVDRSILELLGIDEQTKLNISTDGRALVVVPAHDKRRRKRFHDALTACNQQYGKALKRLAE
jgi:antitoxin MazE